MGLFGPFATKGPVGDDAEGREQRRHKPSPQPSSVFVSGQGSGLSRLPCPMGLAGALLRVLRLPAALGHHLDIPDRCSADTYS